MYELFCNNCRFSFLLLHETIHCIETTNRHCKTNLSVKHFLVEMAEDCEASNPDQLLHKVLKASLA